MTHNAITGPAPPDDDSFLDALLDEALRRRSAGLSFDVGAAIAGRPHLRGEAERLARVAGVVAVRGALRPPAVLGYDLLAELGRGATGTVFLARQRGLLRPVALKVLNPALAAWPDGRARFRAEAQALARVRHPNVVQIFEVVDDGAVCAYAAEWIDGRSLAEALADRRPDGILEATPDPLPWIRTAIAIGRALGAVHRAGLVHRDVKPSNILLRQDGTALLSDFGLAHEAEAAHATAHGAFVGTVAYAAPEQLRGEHAEVGARADIFGLGATLYHALTGEPPVSRSASAGEAHAAHAAGRVPQLRARRPDLPPDLGLILSAAMAVEPEGRYATADEFADDLDRLLALRPIVANPPPLRMRLRLWLRRNRARVAVAALALVVAGAAAVIAASAAWQESERRQRIPDKVASHLRAARLALLDPSNGERIFAAANDAVSVAPSVPLTMVSAERALRAYDAALELDLDRDDVRRERHAVSLAARAIAGPADLDAMPPEGDSRARGLFWFLLGRMTECLAAWEPLAFSIERPDPLVDAALGELYLSRDEGPRAFPLLFRAAEAYPRAGFLWVDLADAANRSGEPAQALAWIRRARKEGMLDPFETDIRVEADALGTLGQVAAARKKFDHMRRAHRAPTSCLRHALFLARLGEREEAARVALEAWRIGPKTRPFRELLQRVVPTWWWRAPGAERVRWVADAFDRSDPDHLAARDLLLALDEIRGSLGHSDSDASPWEWSQGDVPGLEVSKELSRMLSSPDRSPLPDSRPAFESAARLALVFDGALSRRGPRPAPWPAPLRRLLAFAAFASLAGALAPAQTAPLEFDFEFNQPGVLPTATPNVGFAVGLNGGPTPTVNCGVLQQRTASAGTGVASLFYAGSILPGYGASPTAVSVNLSVPVTVEFRATVLSIVGAGGAVDVSDGQNFLRVVFQAPNLVGLLNGATGSYTSFAVTPLVGVPYTYRADFDPVSSTATLSINGFTALAGVPVASNPSPNGWLFGDTHTSLGNNADIDWDFIRIRNGPICSGVGQKNSVGATLSCVATNAAGSVETSGLCAGPHPVNGLGGKTLNLVWSGPPGIPFVLALGPPGPAAANFGCVGTLDLGFPLFIFDSTNNPFGSSFTLDACGLAQQSLTIPGPPVLPAGSALGNIQGAIVQPAGAACPLVITAAFYLSS